MNRRSTSLPKSPLKSRSDLRRPFLRASVVAAMALISGSQYADAANTEYDVNKASGTDLTAAATYTTGGTAGTGVGGTTPANPPSVTSDVTFDTGTYTTTAFTIATPITFGSLNDLSTTAITISNAGGAAASTLTLGGAGDLGDSVPGSNAADLLFVGTGANLTITGGTTTTALGLALGQSGNFDVNGTANITAIISGAATGFTKTGTGNLTLGAANTYTGVTTINGGILYLGNSAAGKILNTSGVVTASGGSLGFTNGNSASTQSAQVGGVISGTGGVTDSENNGNTSLNLNVANTYTGPTTITIRGTLTSSVAPAVDANGNVVSSGFGVNSALVFSGLTANAGETLLLSTTTQFGSLSTGASTTTVAAGNGVVLNNNNLTIGGDSTSTTFNAQISGGAIPNSATNSTRGIGGNLTKIGTGTQTLGGANLYSGSTTITGGTLAVTTIANGGFATTGTVASGSNQLTLASATGAVAGQNIQGSVLGVTAEVISSVSGNVVTLSGNAAAAGTNIPVAFGTANGLGISTNAAANLVLNGGTLRYTGAAASTDRLFTVGAATAGATGTLDASGTGAVNFTNTGAVAYGTVDQTRTLGLTGTNTGANTLAPSVADNSSVAGNGAGAVSLTKSGTGSWTLTGNNTYTGATTVSGGILTATGTGANKALGGTTNIAVNNGGTLLFGAANQANVTAPITLGTTAAQTPASTTGILSFVAGASQGTAATVTGGTVSGTTTTGGTITGTTAAGLGALTLSNTATLAYGGTATTLVFGTFTPNGNVLNVSGYSNNGSQTAGSSGTASDDRLIFSGDQSGNLADFNFGPGAGVGVGEVALDGGFFEVVVAVPEPSTWMAGVICLGMVGAGLLRNRRNSRREAQMAT